MDDKFSKISRFNAIRCDAGEGSGLCIYIWEDFDTYVIDAGVDKTEGTEDLWVQVQHWNILSFIVGCVYRHPKALAASFLYLADVFRNVCPRNKPVFIMGDIHDDLFVKDNNLGKIVRNLNLKQVIDKPTPITSSSTTLLDAAITNKLEMIMNSDVIPSPIDDRKTVSVIINSHKPKHEPKIRTYRSHKCYSLSMFCNLLYH